jgi:hypothetical protein
MRVVVVVFLLWSGTAAVSVSTLHPPVMDIFDISSPYYNHVYQE